MQINGQIDNFESIVEIIMKIIKSEGPLRVTPPKNKKNKKNKGKGGCGGSGGSPGGVGCVAPTGGKDTKDKNGKRITH